MKMTYPFPPHITLAHLFHAPAGWNIHERIMNEYVLQYVVDGICDYPVAGNRYETTKGDLLFHRPGELHSILTRPGSPYVCISIVFHFGGNTVPLDSLFHGKHFLGNFEGTEIERKLTMLVYHYRQPGLAHQLKSQSLLLELLAETAEGSGGERNDPTGEKHNKAKMILVSNFIQQHYNRTIRHSELEEVSGFSRNYVIREFKQCFGLTPMAYQTGIRLQKAKELAVQSNLSISEIAREIGYADVHTFGKMFRKKMGMSLSEFISSLVINRPANGG